MPTLKSSPFFARLSVIYDNNPWKGRTALFILILCTLLILVRASLPYTIIYSANSWLKEQNIDSTIEDISIGVFDGTISLKNARGSRDGKALFDVGLVDIHWRWTPLSSKKAVITKVVLEHFMIDIARYADKIIIGGVTIENATPVEENVPPPANETDKPWALTIGEVLFKDLNICYLQHSDIQKQATDASRQMDYCVDLEKMSWGGEISYNVESSLTPDSGLPLSSSGDFILNGLKVTDNRLNKYLLLSRANTLENVIVNGLNSIHINSLTMNDLSALNRDDKKHKDAIRFSNLTVNDISIKQLSSITIDNINISEPGFYIVKKTATDWEYNQWLPGTKVSTVKTEDASVKNHTTPLTVAINNISISSADNCYLEEHTKLYYCLTFSDLNWKGSINYLAESDNKNVPELTVIGNFDLSKLSIHNSTISRNLLSFDHLKISGIDITGLDDIAIKELQLDNMNALQRSNAANDETLIVNKLSINDTKYTNKKLSINTINVDGITGNISRDEDGVLEHSKWIDDSAAKEQDSNQQASKPDKETLAVSLNHLTVTSNNQILFSDSSTSPVTTAGLSQLSLQLNQLNSSQPNQYTDFTLFAKTTSLSTIDLKGNAKPFAEKVSLDATGKLKGFDLRAASPETKKAIGHIIKSGQLDADLKLLAVDGKLDSNIALALYKFNIEPVDKESQLALNKKFGMPLNQTLVLLRDKDGSIHMDIPITGNVNDPTFNPMDAIIKATSKAATVTLVTFYTPYGLIYAGGNVLFDLATALKFEPVVFKPSSADLEAENRQQLEKLSELLISKPGIHLTMCGVTNQQDLFALYPDLKKTGQTETTVNLTKEQMLALNQLANNRQVISKKYLIENFSIAQERLILCEPEHDTGKDAISGVEINI